ncbi:MAG: hypothetical protein H8D86_01845, partial [Planctomycetes bacterium]|nr:hypothetical protein [Planctomycetota bacterium]
KPNLTIIPIEPSINVELTYTETQPEWEQAVNLFGNGNLISTIPDIKDSWSIAIGTTTSHEFTSEATNQTNVNQIEALLASEITTDNSTNLLAEVLNSKLIIKSIDGTALDITKVTWNRDLTRTRAPDGTATSALTDLSEVDYRNRYKQFNWSLDPFQQYTNGMSFTLVINEDAFTYQLGTQHSQRNISSLTVLNGMKDVINTRSALYQAIKNGNSLEISRLGTETVGQNQLKTIPYSTLIADSTSSRSSSYIQFLADIDQTSSQPGYETHQTTEIETFQSWNGFGWLPYQSPVTTTNTITFNDTIQMVLYHGETQLIPTSDFTKVDQVWDFSEFEDVGSKSVSDPMLAYRIDPTDNPQTPYYLHISTFRNFADNPYGFIDGQVVIHNNRELIRTQIEGQSDTFFDKNVPVILTESQKQNVTTLVSPGLNYQLNISLDNQPLDDKLISLDGKLASTTNPTSQCKLSVRDGTALTIQRYLPDTDEFVIEGDLPDMCINQQITKGTILEIGYEDDDELQGVINSSEYPFKEDSYVVQLSNWPADTGDLLEVQITSRPTITYNSEATGSNPKTTTAKQVVIASKKYRFDLTELSTGDDTFLPNDTLDFYWSEEDTQSYVASISLTATENSNTAIIDKITTSINDVLSGNTVTSEIIDHELILTFLQDIFLENFVHYRPDTDPSGSDIKNEFDPSAMIEFTNSDFTSGGKAITVRAIDDEVIDGSDAYTIPEMGGKLNTIRGPVIIDGGNRANFADALTDPFTLETEINRALPEGSFAGSTNSLTDDNYLYIDKSVGVMPGMDPRIEKHTYQFTTFASNDSPDSNVFFENGVTGNRVAIRPINNSQIIKTDFTSSNAIEVTGWLADDDQPYEHVNITLNYRGKQTADQTWSMTVNEKPYTYRLPANQQLSLENTANGIAGKFVNSGINASVLGRTITLSNTDSSIRLSDLTLTLNNDSQLSAIQNDIAYIKGKAVNANPNWRRIELIPLTSDANNPSFGTFTSSVLDNVITIVESRDSAVTVTEYTDQEQDCAVGDENTQCSETSVEAFAKLLASQLNNATGNGEIHSAIIFNELWNRSPTQSNPVFYFFRPHNPNYDVIESNQVDQLFLFDQNNSINADGLLSEDAQGIVTSSSISGFGMGGDVAIGGRQISGGIGFYNIESLNLDLGQGNNNILIQSTPVSTTKINTGSGDDVVHIESTNGNTFIKTANEFDTAPTTDNVYVTDNGIADQIGGLLVVGGSVVNPLDHFYIDDTNERSDNTGVLSDRSLTGFDMPT